MQAAKQAWSRFTRSPVWRAWKRYGNARGDLLAGGVTYFSFFSLFPAIALGFTILGLLLREQQGLLEQVQEAIEKQLPGFIQTADNPNGLIPLVIPSGTTLSLTALVGVAGLLWAGLGWLGALRSGILAIFGVERPPGNAVTNKLRDVVVLATLGLGLVLAGVLNAATSSVAESLARAIGLGSVWLIAGAGLLVSFLANAGLVALMLRVLSGVDLPWSGVRKGAIFGGVALTVLQTSGTRLIAGTMGNKLFASIALVVGLLAFLNFIARAMLLSAAWAANDFDDLPGAQDSVSEGESAKLAEGPATRDQAAAQWTERSSSGLPVDPAARAAVGLPTFDQRAGDRVSVAAGAVLGAAATALTATALGAARAARRR